MWHARGESCSTAPSASHPHLLLFHLLQQVPKGMEKCVSTMRKGETCELICRSEYAYGDEGKLPEVPSGASVRYVLPKPSQAKHHTHRHAISRRL